MGIVSQQKTQAGNTVPMRGLVIVSMTPAELSAIWGVEARIDASLFAAVQPVAPVEACPGVAAELVEHCFHMMGATELELEGQIPDNQREEDAEQAGRD